jgi:BlaI family transcriptional regulator, penicillinase repressor
LVPMPRSTLPTDAETAILGVLWRRGPSTVREVHESLEQRDVGYTTVLKLMQIMLQKGLLTRDESERSHVYAAAVAREASEARALGNLRERLFGGSTGQLVLRALSEAPATRQELEAIKAKLDGLLAERTKRQGKGS